MVTFREKILKCNKKCKEKNARKQQKYTLLLYPIPKRPWKRLSLDIFTYANKSYLGVSDSFFKLVRTVLN